VSLRRILSCLLLAGALVGAEWSTSPLGAFAVATLADESVVARLQARFHASGKPVFLMGNPVAGVQQGDILRFSDKAFLVDADVWQTLSAEGALRALRQSPVVRVQAAANPGAWNARARIVSGSREKKLYEFGAALLKSLEQSMGGVPQGQRLFLSLEGGQLVLTAPATFLDKLRAPVPVPAAAVVAEPRERIPFGRPKWFSPPPGDSLLVGQKVLWRPWAEDDSGGPTAGFRYEYQGDIPTGLSWDEGSRTLQGVPQDTGHFASRWTVSSERGSDTFTWCPSVRTPAQRVVHISTEGLSVEMPWDTLLEHRWYEWDPGQVRADWDDAGIALDSVRGDGDISWNGRTLVFRPRAPGRTDFHFVFRERGVRRIVDVSKPVKAYLPPVFLSRLGGSTVLEGEVRTYHPVVVDPQGGPVQILAEVPPGSPLSWDGRDLVASPQGPGAWAARLEARDTLDQVKVQWVEFHSQAKSTAAVTIRHRWEAGAAPWEAELDLGSGRIGLFTPDLGRMVAWKTWTRQDWPFLYGGMELLGEESRRRGNSLGGDLGFTLRIPDPKILTGGIMARIHATASAQPEIPWTFEGETFGWLRQGILLTDTVGYNGLVSSQIGGSGDPETDARYDKVFRRIQADDFDRHNLVIFTRLEGWLHLPLGLGAGVGLWREDLPVENRYDQRVGIGARWRPTTPAGMFSAAIRAGWGSAESGAALWGDLVWTTGILP
jgi:hypothetical protein